MIIIEKKIYEEIKNLNFEDCGFILGRKNNLFKLYKCKNKSKFKNQYSIGIIDLIIVFFIVIFGRFSFACVYHIHKELNFPSPFDIKNMMDEFVYAIATKDDISFYTLFQKNVIKLSKEVI